MSLKLNKISIYAFFEILLLLSNESNNEQTIGGGNSFSALRLKIAKNFFPPNRVTFLPSSVSVNSMLVHGSLARASSSGTRSKQG